MSSSATDVREALSSVQEWIGVSAEKLMAGEALTSMELRCILKRAMTSLSVESSLLELKRAECRVVGQLHGSLADLLAIFRQFGWPSGTTYVFLGNYICLDMQGQLQIGVLLMLLLFKVVYPSNILLLRGLHECEHCAAEMGLIDVCMDQFSGNIYQDLVLLFKFLPLAALVNQVYFLSCGSLSLTRGYLIDYEVVDRPRTTCSKANNRLAYLPHRMSSETLRRFRDWDREQDAGDYRNLRLFLSWNNLTAVIRSCEVDWTDQLCPIVEGPGNSLVSLQSASVADGRPVTGCILAIHRNRVCTFHPVRLGTNMQPTVKMLVPADVAAAAAAGATGSATVVAGVEAQV